MDWIKTYIPETWIDCPDVQQFIDWISGQTTSERKKEILKEYLRSLKEFCEMVGKLPADILDEQDADEKKARRQRQNPVKKYLHQFVELLKQRDLSPNYISTKVAHIKTFLKSNDFDVRGFKCPRGVLTHQPIQMTKALAYETYQSANRLQHRTIIYALWSSGLSISDLLKLNIDDIERLKGWGYARINRTKTGHRFITVFSPDCMKQIERYLRTRKDDCPALFVNRYYKRLSRHSVSKALHALSKQMGLATNGIACHNFRRGHNMALKVSGLDSEFVEFLQARKAGTKSHYGQYSPEQIIKVIEPHVGALSFSFFKRILAQE